MAIGDIKINDRYCSLGEDASEDSHVQYMAYVLFGKNLDGKITYYYDSLLVAYCLGLGELQEERFRWVHALEIRSARQFEQTRYRTRLLG